MLVIGVVIGLFVRRIEEADDGDVGFSERITELGRGAIHHDIWVFEIFESMQRSWFCMSASKKCAPSA